MPNTNEYMREYLKQYRVNHPEFRANELIKNNERNKAKYHSDAEFRNKVLEYKKKYCEQKKLAKFESVEIWGNLNILLAKANAEVNILKRDLKKYHDKKKPVS